MIELAQVALPLLKSLPVWVTLAVVGAAVGVVLYMRARGASLDEHVSLSKATLSQMQALVALNEQLNDQIAAMREQIAELEAKVEHLEAQLKKAKGV